MGMDADIIAIGPFEVFDKMGLLEYPRGSYCGADPKSQIIVTIAGADTTDQSRDLATLCCVEPWDLCNHRITQSLSPLEALSLEFVGTEPPQMIAERLRNLLRAPNVQLWFRPNG